MKFVRHNNKKKMSEKNLIMAAKFDIEFVNKRAEGDTDLFK